MAARLTIDDAELQQALAFASRATVRELAEDAGAALLQSTRRRFETQSDPDGRPWKPLAPRTVRKRIRPRGPRRGALNILRLTTRLYRSITYSASETRVQVGSNVVYAGVHQGGGSIEMRARSQKGHLRRIRVNGTARSRFATAKHKSAREIRFTIGAHTLTIPARPYLGFSAADIETIRTLGREWMSRRFGGGAPS